MEAQKRIRPEVLTEEELPELLGAFFERGIGRRLGRELLRLLGIDKINEIHSTFHTLEGKAFTTQALAHPYIDVSYRLHGEEQLARMASEQGGFITIANHPFGSLDGIMLIDIISAVRPDFRVMANNILSRIEALRDSFIPVHPRQNKKDYTHDPSKNISGIRMISQQLAEGHPVGMFPAGGVAQYKFLKGRSEEQQWQLNSARIIRGSGVPVYPIFFEGRNSLTYHFLALFSYGLKTLRIPRELFNKRGKCFEVYIGAPILPEEIERYQNVKELREMLRHRTLSLPHEMKGKGDASI